MKQDSPPLFSTLYSRILAPASACAGCGACVLVCPRDRLVFRDSRPEQVSGEKDRCPENRDGRCGLCAMVCPRLHEDEAARAGGEPEIVAARTTDPELAGTCQDGGLVSSIARWGLESNRWSSFVGYARDEAWRPFPRVVTAGADVAGTAGSKYTYTPIHEALSALYESGRASAPFAMVGLPCHVAALRRLQQIRSKYVKGLDLCIGLFCMKAFSYERLIQDRIVGRMQIPIQEVTAMDIRRGSLSLTTRSGAAHRIPLKELGDAGHSGCASCTDFPAELADLSVGGLGTDGWTIALIRTEAGREVLQAVEASGRIETADPARFPKALELLGKLTVLKRKQAVRARA